MKTAEWPVAGPQFPTSGWPGEAFAGVAMVTAPLAGEVVPARAQMATTLGFHIILASLAIAFPTIVPLAEFVGLRRRNETAMKLARRWSQVLGVLVAVGAVTGTVLSFEMGLLWPGLMRRYRAVLRFPFGVEGIFFFLEAIFTAIYLYGWRRLSGWAQFWRERPRWPSSLACPEAFWRRPGWKAVAYHPGTPGLQHVSEKPVLAMWSTGSAPELET